MGNSSGDGLMRSRGFTIVGIVAVVCAIAAASAGAWAFWKHYTGLLEAKGKAEQTLADTRQALEDQGNELDEERADRAALEQILADRELELRKIKSEREERDAQLAELRLRPEVAAWLDGVIPDALLERLRGRAAGGGDKDQGRARVPGPQPGAADAGAAVPRPPQ